MVFPEEKYSSFTVKIKFDKYLYIGNSIKIYRSQQEAEKETESIGACSRRTGGIFFGRVSGGASVLLWFVLGIREPFSK